MYFHFHFKIIPIWLIFSMTKVELLKNIKLILISFLCQHKTMEMDIFRVHINYMDRDLIKLGLMT